MTGTTFTFHFCNHFIMAYRCNTCRSSKRPVTFDVHKCVDSEKLINKKVTQVNFRVAFMPEVLFSVFHNMLKPVVQDTNKNSLFSVLVNGPPLVNPVVLNPIRIKDYDKNAYWQDLIDRLPFDYLGNIEGIYTIQVTVDESEEPTWEV